MTIHAWDAHCHADILLGMTLQPGKCDALDVHTVLDQEPKLQDRLIVNSDGAPEMSRPFLQGGPGVVGPGPLCMGQALSLSCRTVLGNLKPQSIELQ